jgi:DNA polymerase III subunit gamma/tau
MKYEPLHHKYRPQIFGDLVGQEAIATTLSNALTSERIAPAYLFTGPRGTGKTSSARILAKSLNCLSSGVPTPIPCGQCEVCRAIANGSALDVIEIDAASNTGVDNIREIIERAQFAPVQCRYKVYVVDECHMLSTAAFNALLKTLEEPPDRVIFVLATTDPQRVLPTIISRCQRFDYRRIPLEAMVGHLQKIAHLEAIDIDLEAITLIAQIANGGLRDAESLLDQLSLLAGTVTADRVWELVGAVPERDLLTLLKAIRSDVADAVVEQCRHLMNRGKEPLIVLQNLAGFYLNLLLAKTAPSRPDLVAVTAPTWQELCTEARAWSLDDILRGQQTLKDSEVQLKNTTQPRLWLEIILLGLLPAARVSPSVTVVEAPRMNPSVSPPPVEPKPVAVATPAVTVEPQAATLPRETSPPAPHPETGDIWPRVLEALPQMTRELLRQQGSLLSVEESSARVGIASEQLLVKFARPRLANIESAFEAVCQRQIKVNLQVGTALESTPVVSPEPAPAVRVEHPPLVVNKPAAVTPIVEEVRPPAPVVVSKPAAVTPIAPTVAEPAAIADDELLKAARSLAKFFEGEIVHLEPPAGEPPPPEVKTEKPAANTITVRGRPDIQELDEEDIPF